MRLWDTGVRLYALPYYATAETIRTKADVLQKFLRATGRGWAHAHANRAQAVDFLVKEFPNLNKSDELAAADVMLEYAFSARTKTQGWGAMDPAVWQEQIDLYAELGQFSKRTPKLDEVMTMDILNATADARPKIG
jgi:NitT/TauT family transport system substrate-binding protein